jgi:hypothetical protein
MSQPTVLGVGVRQLADKQIWDMTLYLVWYLLRTGTSSTIRVQRM